MTPDRSQIQRLADRLASLPDPHGALDEVLSALSPVQLAYVRRDWSLWARSKQVVPQGPWKSFGFLTGIGFGKTRALSEFVTTEVRAARAGRIGLVAQNEDKTYEVMIDGKSGLIATSPPWFKARFANGRVEWPNGAQAFPYTPEVPGAMRGPEHDLVWLSELVAWPVPTRDEALNNIRRRARLGYGKMIWDTSPKKRHPLIRRLLERAARDPEHHIIVRGSMRENVDNLTAGYVEDQYAEYGGTQQGREELEGEFLDDSDGALWKQEWIDRNRRPWSQSFLRRIVSVDPAFSTKKSTDKTGIVLLGLAPDRHVCVAGNLTGKHAPEAWARIVLDVYVRDGCDCVVVERNRGGDLVVANLRGVAATRGLAVVVLGPKEPPRHIPGVVYVREVHSTRSKETRAEPVASLYERGRVSHLLGADLGELEDVMTTWEPSPSAQSPDALDALVHGVWELAGLGDNDRPVDEYAGRPEPERQELVRGEYRRIYAGEDSDDDEEDDGFGFSSKW